jgi:hypothetical protein
MSPPLSNSVRADARIEIKTSRSDTKPRGKQKKVGCCALPLHDIPVTAAFIHPWMSPPLSKSIHRVAIQNQSNKEVFAAFSRASPSTSTRAAPR